MYSCNTIYVLCMYNNITPRVRGSYEMADSQRGAVGCNHLIYPTSACGIIVLLKISQNIENSS